MGQVLGSVGEDLKLKIWQENTSEATNSGRRFRCVFSQSSGNSVVYNSLDFVNPGKETYLVIVTRDGLLSLLEPINPERFDDWREIDQIWVCDEPVARGVETSFKVCFQQADQPNIKAMTAGLDKTALSLAVTAIGDVKVYRVLKMLGHGGQEQYKLQDPVTELKGADGLVRDVAWSQEIWRAHDWIATTAADGYIRVYEMWTPKGNVPNSPNPSVAARKTPTTGGEMATKPRAPSGIGAGLAGASLAASFASVKLGHHEVKLAAQLKHDGVWKVEWLRNSHTLVSSGDNGQARMWKQAHDGNWHEFAEFGPDN